MINFLLHTSINSRGYLMDYIKRNLPELEREIGDSVFLNTPSNDHSRSWLLESLSENKMPDVMLTHASDFSVIETGRINDLFSKNAGGIARDNPIRKELKVFEDTEGVFYPLFIVPMVMFYNTKMLKEDELTNSWTDLFNEKLSIIFPDEDTPISKVVMASLKKNYESDFNSFMKKVTFGKSPVEVIQAVATGQYHMGISNLSFSMMARQKNIEINWPNEGAIPLPQVLVLKKNANPQLIKIAELLIRDEVQTYLGEQGFWAISENAPLDGLSSENLWMKSWSGWSVFIERIQAVETEKKEGGVFAC